MRINAHLMCVSEWVNVFFFSLFHSFIFLSSIFVVDFAVAVAAVLYYPFDVCYIQIHTFYYATHGKKVYVSDYKWTHSEHWTQSEWESWIVSLNYSSLWANFFSLPLLLLLLLSFANVMMIYKKNYILAYMRVYCIMLSVWVRVCRGWIICLAFIFRPKISIFPFHILCPSLSLSHTRTHSYMSEK